MPPKAESSTAYRDKAAEDSDDDLDDLDDVLASFNNPKSAPARSADPPIPPPPKSRGPTQSGSADDEEDFEASLAEGMESLLRQLAGDHPPGPMPGRSEPTAEVRKPELSADEEEAAFQKAIEMLMSKEGISALGLNDSSSGDEDDPPLSTSGPSAKGSAKPASSFEETIKKAMESLDSAGSKKGGSGGDPADLARLLAQMGSDPSLDGEGDDELSGILEGMMGQLMTREVLEEPMAELASKYPSYLSSPPADVSTAELEKYRNQATVVQKIVDTFRKPDYSDEKDGKEITRLVTEMQDLGSPPKEIMGDLPEGFDLGALAGDDACTIM